MQFKLHLFNFLLGSFFFLFILRSNTEVNRFVLVLLRVLDIFEYLICPDIKPFQISEIIHALEKQFIRNSTKWMVHTFLVLVIKSYEKLGWSWKSPKSYELASFRPFISWRGPDNELINSGLARVWALVSYQPLCQGIRDDTWSRRHE